MAIKLLQKQLTVLVLMLVLASCGQGTNKTVKSAAGADTAKPVIESFTVSPATLTAVGQVVTLEVVAKDDTGVSKVEFYRVSSTGSTSLTTTDTSAPYKATFSFSSASKNGIYVYLAKVYDAANNVTTSNNASYQVAIPVSCTSNCPTVSLAPSSSLVTVAGGTVTLTATTTNVAKVEFYRKNGTDTYMSTDTSAPFTQTFAFADSSKNGTYTYYAKAFKADGAIATSSNASFTVGIGTCTTATTDTTWATGCSNTKTACVAGSWNAGPNTMTTGTWNIKYQTEHFAFRWDSSSVTQSAVEQGAAALEASWNHYINVILFPEPYCDSATKTKINVYIDPTFGYAAGQAGGPRDMAMWIHPDGLTGDHWAISHELAHDLQVSTMGFRDSPYVGWAWESHAQWMVHQLPQFHNSNVSCSELLINAPHLYYGSTRNRYCNFQFWEFVKNKYCYQKVHEIWTKSLMAGTAGVNEEDPFSSLARNMNWSASQLNDFMATWAMHNAHWDYKNPDGSDQSAVYRSLYGSNVWDGNISDRFARTTKLNALDTTNRRYAVPSYWAPQRWGYNLIRLRPDAGSTSVGVTFRGVLQSASAGSLVGLNNDPSSVSAPNSDWRWGLITVDSNNVSKYSPLQRGSDNQLSLCLSGNETAVWMVVMGTPSAIQKIRWDQPYYSIYRYPWMAQFSGAQPDGFQAGAPNPTTSGARHANGGGWVAAGANVAATAYVGPNAQVRGGTVSGNARIEDHAIVVSGTVSDNAVIGALTMVKDNAVVSGNAKAKTTFLGLGAFDANVVLNNTAKVYGDVEMYGITLSSGAYSGIVESGSLVAGNGANLTDFPTEVTAAPSYVWR